MASAFLAEYGYDLDQILDENGIPTLKRKDSLPLPAPEPVQMLRHVLLPGSSTDKFDIEIDPKSGTIVNVGSSSETEQTQLPFRYDCNECLTLPSMCHPHIHLDKPYLLSHPLTSHLAPESGDFKEALSMTGEAKKLYTRDSLVERGNWLIADSVRAGVTHMRAFVEVDATVKLMCVEAGLYLKGLWAGRCEIQICAFAQDPLFTGENAAENRDLMLQAVKLPGVDVVGSTPYVESDDKSSRQNIDFTHSIAIENKKHLDFHLDYFLDPEREAMVWHVLDSLIEKDWKAHNPGKTVVLGHCTRLTLFSNNEWQQIADKIKHKDLPVHFVGLPTSDIFMMARVGENQQLQDRKRGSLQIPWLIENMGLNGALGINNVGNAFTPQGSPDPLDLVSWCVGLYQTGTPKQAELLYECVSTRAKAAIGVLAKDTEFGLIIQGSADIVVLGEPKQAGHNSLFRRRRSVAEIVYHAPAERMAIRKGRLVRF